MKAWIILQKGFQNFEKMDRTKYYPRWGDYHYYDKLKKRCEVCLGGGHLVVNGWLPEEPAFVGRELESDIPVNCVDMVSALELFRAGWFRGAFNRLELELTEENEKELTEIYNINVAGLSNFDGWQEFDTFVEAYKSIIEYLQKVDV